MSQLRFPFLPPPPPPPDPPSIADLIAGQRFVDAILTEAALSPSGCDEDPDEFAGGLAPLARRWTWFANEIAALDPER